MNRERWKEVERLYFATLEREAAEQPEFLRQACPGDDDLRREVESLLKQQSRFGVLAPSGLGLLADLWRSQESAPGRHAGHEFGPYRLDAHLASGGAGEVYRALDQRVGRTVAVKVLHRRHAADGAWRERLQREARVISSLNHPHICTLFDVGTHEDTDFLVMEFATGETLRQRLTRGKLPLTLATEYALQTLEALKLAHAAGFVHRDLKPENIMVSDQGVKILDFGLAVRIMDVVPEADENSIFGTPGYCAPEQLEGKPVDARTDIFSFGLVLYEMITGERAFPASNPVRLVGATLYEMPRDVRESDPAIPPSFAEILSRCLAKEPESRWQSVSDLLFALRSFGNHSAEARTQPTPRPKAWTYWLAAALLSATALLITRQWLSSRSRAAAISDSPEIRFHLFPPKGAEFFSGYDVPFALSPDGRRSAKQAFGNFGCVR